MRVLLRVYFSGVAKTHMMAHKDQERSPQLHTSGTGPVPSFALPELSLFKSGLAFEIMAHAESGAGFGGARSGSDGAGAASAVEGGAGAGGTAGPDRVAGRAGPDRSADRGAGGLHRADGDHLAAAVRRVRVGRAGVRAPAGWAGDGDDTGGDRGGAGRHGHPAAAGAAGSGTHALVGASAGGLAGPPSRHPGQS